MEQKEKQEEWVLLYQIPGDWGRKKKFAAFGQGHTHVYFEDYNSPDKNS